MDGDDRKGSLQDYRIIDLTNRYGVLGTRILAGLGAEVICVEPPGGDPMRRMGPTYEDASRPDVEPTSLYWYQMNAAKKSIIIDLASAVGREQFTDLLDGADVLFESGSRRTLEEIDFSWDALHRRHPKLVYTTISPFGLGGPRSGWKGGDLIAMAAGGLLSLCGDPDRAPLRPTAEQASAQGALQAVVGTLIALRARGRGAGGQRVDVSMQEAITNTLGNSQAFYAMEGVIDKRAGGGRASGATGTRLIFPCADGHIAYLRSPATIPLLHKWMLDEGFEPGFDPDFWSRRNVVGKEAPSKEEVQALESRFEAFFADRTKMELYEEGQERGTQICPVATVPDILANRQLAQRDYFQDVEHPEWGRSFTYPGPPFKMSASPWRAGPAAPSPGQHQDEFFPLTNAKPGGGPS